MTSATSGMTNGGADDVNDAFPTPERAARMLFANPRALIDFQAADETEARRGIEEFAHLFEDAPGVFKDAFEGARESAQTLSGDRLQGIAEIIQNADDADATFVELQIRDDHLIAVHNGHPVTLSDVLSLATPWLSNKTANPGTTGRFGIGLMTLRVLSDVLDVHSGPYHMRLGDPTISAIEPDDLPVELPDPGTTALCLPLRDGATDIGELAEWLSRWDDSALLFLRHVSRVTLLGSDGLPVLSLTLSWSEDAAATCIVDGHELVVQRRHVQARDGRSWLVHTVDVPRPEGLSRARKASGMTVPFGLALPLQPEDGGVIYAGLPVEATRMPVRINAQFDPLTSRTGLAPTDWNSALLPLLADLWVEVAEDLFAERPVIAWGIIPLPAGEQKEHPASVTGRLEALLLNRARTELARRAAIAVNGARLLVTELAVEDMPLEDVLEPAEVASLVGLPATMPSSARDAAGRWRVVLDDWRSAGAPVSPLVTVEMALALLNRTDRSPAATISLTAVGLAAGLAGKLAALPCVVSAAGEHIIPPAEQSLQVLLAVASPLAEQLGVGIPIAREHLDSGDDAESVMAWLLRIGAIIDNPGDEVVVRRLAAAARRPPTHRPAHRRSASRSARRFRDDDTRRTIRAGPRRRTSDHYRCVQVRLPRPDGPRSSMPCGHLPATSDRQRSRQLRRRRGQNPGTALDGPPLRREAAIVAGAYKRSGGAEVPSPVGRRDHPPRGAPSSPAPALPQRPAWRTRHGRSRQSSTA
jgi:hypothetical protein